MSDLGRLISKAFATGKKGITLWPSVEHGYQANVQNEDGSWAVRMAADPEEALVAALESATAFPRYRNAPKAGDERPEKKRRREIEDLA